ncbi:hypothetical protein [Desulfocurvus sp. DL9XJH121]
MTDQNKLTHRLVDKIGDAYLRLSRDNEDEGEVRRRLYAYTRKALSMLGFKLTAQKMEERCVKLAEVAIQRAIKQQESERWIKELEIGGPGGGYSIHFLPDVHIPRSPETEARWREFLQTLAPKTRVGTDPKTGQIGVLYRDGMWLGDLILADDVRSFNISPDIHSVAGDLVARGALMINKAFTHAVQVRGGLHVHHELLRQPPPPVTFEGELRLAGLKSLADAPVRPEDMETWGVRPGTEVTVRSDRLEFAREGDRAVLRGINVLSAYTWRKDRWAPAKQERIDPALFEAVHSRLERICVLLGLGQDMISKSVLRTPDNIDRITLYLDLGLAVPGTDPVARHAGGNMVRALSALRGLFLAKRIDDKAVAEALAVVREQDAERAAGLAEAPRKKISEKALREDLALVTRLTDDDLDAAALFGNGLGAISALQHAFRSPEARENLRTAFKTLDKTLEETSSRISADHRPGFGDLLRDHRSVLEVIKEGLAAFGGRYSAKRLEGEIKEIAGMNPGAVFRVVSRVPYKSEDPAFVEDMALLRVLYEARTLEKAVQTLDTDRLLGLVLPRLCPAAASRLRRALDRLRGCGEDPGPMAENLAARFRGLPQDKVPAELRAWLRSLLAVVREYNTQSVQETVAERRKDDRQRKEFAMISLPPHVVRDLSARMARICLKWSLGRGFLEGVDATMASDLERLIHYLDLNLGRTAVKHETTLQGQDLAAVENVWDKLKNLRHCLDTADFEEAQAALAGLDDKALETAADAQAKPRQTVDTTLLRRDRDYLDGLKDTRMTLEKLFGHSGRFLLCANDCLESVEMRRAISDYVKPLYLALAKAGKAAKGLTANDLLKNSERPDESLAATDFDDKTREAIRETLDKVNSRSISELLTELRRAAPGGQGGVARDHEMLGRILALPGKPLGSLQLDSSQTCKMLLANLDSPFIHRVCFMRDSGAFGDLPSKRIVSMVLDRLEWELSVIQNYNRLSTLAQ